MKKRTLGLFLALLMILSGALAEDPYTPGEITKELFQTSYDAGKMVGGDVYGTFSLPEGFLEAGSEDEAFYDALQTVLNDIGLNVGVGKLDDGLRLELAGLYVPDGGEASFLGGSHAFNLTEEGLSFESSLLEGDRVTVQWDTLLELAGIPMTTEDIKTTFRTAQDTLSAESVLTSAQEAQKLLMPYAITLADFLMTLDMEEENHVEADGIFPAVDHELTIYFTTEDAARLCSTLSAQMAKDTALQNVLPDTLTLSQELSSLAAALSEGDPESCMLLVGYCDDGLPLHAIYMEEQEENTFSSILILTPDEADENTYTFFMDSYLVNENEEVLDEVTVNAGLTLMPEDGTDFGASGFLTAEDDDGMDTRLHFSLNGSQASPDEEEVFLTLSVTDDDEEEMTLEFGLSVNTANPDEQGLVGYVTITAEGETLQLDFQWFDQAYDEEGQPGRGKSFAFSLSLPEDEGGFLTEAALLQNRTEEAGESTSFYLNTTMQMDEENTQDMFDVQGTLVAVPAEDTFEGVLLGQASVLGLAPGLDAALYTWDYDPASTEALNEIKLEELSVDEMNALTARLQEAFMNQLGETIDLFSPEIVEAIQVISEYGSSSDMVQ